MKKRTMSKYRLECKEPMVITDDGHTMFAEDVIARLNEASELKKLNTELLEMLKRWAWLHGKTTVDARISGLKFKCPYGYISRFYESDWEDIFMAETKLVIAKVEGE